MERQYFTATDLGSYFHFSCQLALWNTFHQKQGQKPNGQVHSARTKATFSRGRTWENRIVKRLDDLGLILKRVNFQSLQTQVENDPRDHFFVIGASFKDDELFKQEYLARGVSPVSFGTFKPDFIEIWKRPDGDKVLFEYHVIDAKSSKSVKVSHQVQVFFYWRALQELLPSEVFVPSSTASIWLLNEETPTPFIPTTLKPQMESFLFSTLSKIVGLPFEQVHWHFNSVCETCQFRTSCRERTEQEATVSMIPDLTIEEATFLREVIQLARPSHEATEIEDLDRLVSGDLRAVDVIYPTTAKRFRSILGMKRGENGVSPVLEAIKTRKIQVLNKPTFHFPKDEDYAVIISLVLDPQSLSSQPELLAFEITVFRGPVLDWQLSEQSAENVVDNFIASLSRILSSIMSKGPIVRTQLYCFSSAEISAINEIIVFKALSDSSQDSEDLRICIGAVVDIPLALLTRLPPELLDNALYRSWAKASRQQLVDHLSDLSLDTEGSLQDLRDRLQAAMTAGNPSPRRLPKVVCLHRTILDLLAIPSSGYTTLGDCANSLFGHCLVPGEDELYSLARDNQNDLLKVKMRARGMTVHRIIRGLRDLLHVQCHGDVSRILLNEGRPLSPAYPQLCRDLNLRKLIFMHEYKALLTLRELWKERIDSSRPAPVLEFIDFAKDGSWSTYFKILEGGKDIDVTGEMRLFEWMLCRLNTDGQAEILFDDLAYYNTFFPVAKDKWINQSDTVLKNLSLAHPVTINVPLNNDTPTITLQLYRSSDFKLEPGDTFRLLRRYLDFTLPKILRNFLEIDVSSRTNSQSLFLRLLDNPASVGQAIAGDVSQFAREERRLYTLYHELSRLGNSDAKQLVFQPSQRRAMQSILKRQATIVWGPPGSGKTHTLALSMLQLFEILHRTTKDKVVVWMAAVTNAAIDIFLNKFQFLCDRVRSIPDLSNSWLNDLKVLRIQSGPKPALPRERLTLAAGTVWQLWNWIDRYRHTPNVLIIDEAGQMNVGTAALVMRWLDDNGRFIVAGDHLQLAPILKGVYPKSERSLFGSILHCLLQCSKLPSFGHDDTGSETSGSDMLYQLEENFRMNPQLCNFVELIYQKKFQPFQPRRAIVNLGLNIAKHLDTVPRPLSSIGRFLTGMSEVMQFEKSAIMRIPQADRNTLPKATTMFVMNLQSKFDAFTPAEVHVAKEAKLVAALVRDLAIAFVEETIFVVTPHRVQRSLVTKELNEYGLPLRTRGNSSSHSSSRIWVDTTERMQGSEADIVICLLSHTHTPSLRRDLDFLYNRPRLNVAISRAKTISIVISSTGVLNPPIEALVDADNLEGYAYLKAFEERAWSFDLAIGIQNNFESPKALEGPQFSSQDYDDSSWEATVKEAMEGQNEVKSSQTSSHSSAYDDPELVSLIQSMQL